MKKCADCQRYGDIMPIYAAYIKHIVGHYGDCNMPRVGLVRVRDGDEACKHFIEKEIKP